MSLKRRDLLLNGSGIAAALAVSQFASSDAALAQAPRPPGKWQLAADVVVIGSGATGLPAAIVAREAGASVILVEAEKDIGGHAITQRRQCPARRRHQRAEEIRHRGFARSAVPRPDRLVGGRAERLPRLPLQRSRDHPRLCRQQRADLRMAGRARRGLRRQGARRCSAATSVGNSVPREMHGAVMDWPMVQTGKPADPDDPGDAVVRQRPDAAAGSRGARRPACRSCSNTA